MLIIFYLLFVIILFSVGSFQRNAEAVVDLMDDVYALDTEKEQQHRQELSALRAQIAELERENQCLKRDKKQIEHNFSLLLVSGCV